jgi:hypothetical protein
MPAECRPAAFVGISTAQSVRKGASGNLKLGRSQMPPIEWYLQRADELAKEVVNAWELKEEAATPPVLTDDFKDLFDKACQYRIAKTHADNRRQVTEFNKMDALEEQATRQAFAEAYKSYREKNQTGASA